MPTLKSNLEKYLDTLVSVTASEESSKKKESVLYTEEIWPMLSDISLPKPSISLSKILSESTYVLSTLRLNKLNTYSDLWLPEEPLVLPVCASFTP